MNLFLDHPDFLILLLLLHDFFLVVHVVHLNLNFLLLFGQEHVIVVIRVVLLLAQLLLVRILKSFSLSLRLGLERATQRFNINYVLSTIERFKCLSIHLENRLLI